MNGINEEIEKIKKEIEDLKKLDEVNVLKKERNRLLNKTKLIYKIWAYVKNMDKK